MKGKYTLIPKTQMVITNLVISLLFFSFLLLPLYPNYSNKIFNINGIIAIILFFISFKNEKIKKWSFYFIPITLFLIGLSEFTFSRVYKTPDSLAINSYRNYFEMGKIAIFGSFILLVTIKNIALSKFTLKHCLYIAILTQSIFIGYSFYQYFILNLSRITLSLSSGADATGAAYTLVFTSIYVSLTILHSQIKYKHLFFYILFILNLTAIIMTGTRSAILVYPIVIIACYLYHFHKNNQNPIKKLVLIIIPIICVSFFFQSSITSRFDSLKYDIQSYEKKNSHSSVGARLAMYALGYESAYEKLFWQSIEERNTKIMTFIKANPQFSGAIPHINGHLHNDFIETLSTRGWSGVLLLITFFISMLYFSIFVMKNIFLTGFTITLIVLGFSDTLIYASLLPLGWVIPLCLFYIYLFKLNR